MSDGNRKDAPGSDEKAGGEEEVRRLSCLPRRRGQGANESGGGRGRVLT